MEYLEAFIAVLKPERADYGDSGYSFDPASPLNEDTVNSFGPNADPDNDGDVDLTDAQKFMAQATIGCVQQFGMFTMDDGISGADYQKENWNLAHGVACKNCIFYQGAGECSVVMGNIDPLGVCHFVIVADPKAADDDATDDALTVPNLNTYTERPNDGY